MFRELSKVKSFGVWKLLTENIYITKGNELQLIRDIVCAMCASHDRFTDEATSCVLLSFLIGDVISCCVSI